MSTTALFIASLVLVPALGLVAWAGFAMTQLEEDMRSLGGFEDEHFDIGRHTTQQTEGHRWPTSG